jgi:TetR/AcrR family acrAB operon transcriptional repressor
VDRVVFKEDDADPLQGIEMALQEIFHILRDQAEVRETFEIISFKCEYVNEFSGMMQCTGGQPDFLGKLTEAYRGGPRRAWCCAGSAPADLAHDTFLFVGGLIKHWLAGGRTSVSARSRGLIRTHVALRRA